MFTAITLWVLIATASDGRAMLSQQFQSQAACVAAKRFLESKRGTYIFAECLADTAPSAPGASSTKRSTSILVPTRESEVQS